MLKHSWIYKTALLTFVLAIIISLISEILLRNIHIAMAFFVLLFIVCLGVIFDTIGIAVTSCEEKAFHSMAAKKIKSAHYSLDLLKNASQVANFCNDVVGDISGIVSGGAVVIIVTQIYAIGGLRISETFFSIIFSGIIASLTVGGKAFGKEIAIKHSKEIVDVVGRLLCFVDTRKSSIKSILKKFILKINVFKKDR